MFISQIYILSPRGDKIVFKDYRQDVPRTSDEIFFRKVKFWDGVDHQAMPGDCPPCFFEKGIHFSFVKKNGLMFVATTLHNTSPSLLAEILNRVIKICKDFLGVMSEEAVRKNFVLVYELLDEMMDYGVVQELTSERLRPYIFNDVVAVQVPKEEIPAQNNSLISRIKRGEFTEKTRRSDATQFSIVHGSKERKNEIYIDILERLNVTFNASGSVVTSEVDGSIIMKSFLEGSPELYLGLNEDLVIGRGDKEGRARYSTVVLDSVNFHESADYSRFESDRVLMMRPPDGEFTVMNYRLTGEFSPPFRITPSIEVQSSYKAEVTLRVRADIASHIHGMNVTIKMPVPKSTTSLGVELGVGASSQTHEYRAQDRFVTWTIPKFQGATEHVVKIRFSTSAPINAATRKEIGPISMNFEVPMHSVCGLGIKSLRLEERSQSYNPQRWVRNITQANSYIFRMS